VCNLAKVPMSNTPENYLWAYDLPKWYTDLGTSTPTSIMFIKEEVEEKGIEYIAQQVAKEYSGKSLMLKDWLKSRKHEWFDACFIRDASDVQEIIRVTSNFIRLQGEDFYGGLVFREFIDLEKVGIHPKSHMPMAQEYRVFFLDQEPIFITQYWTDGAVYTKEIESPDLEMLRTFGKKLNSSFVALDIALGEGFWWIIEVNDGGSAGLPDHVDPNEFYKILFDKLNG
jgi:hypothetical protein